MSTLKELAQEAIRVQDSCNLSGVAHSFEKLIMELWEHARQQNKGTDWVNTHPIVQLYVDKMASLARVQGNVSLTEAWNECERLAKEG